MKKIKFDIEGIVKGNREKEFEAKIASICYQYLYKDKRKVRFSQEEKNNE